MARKHAKKFSKKVSVTRTVIRPAVLGDKRTVTEVPEGTPDAVLVVQDDGSPKWFLVTHNIIHPAVIKTVANGPTTTKGKRQPEPDKKGAKK